MGHKRGHPLIQFLLLLTLITMTRTQEEGNYTTPQCGESINEESDLLLKEVRKGFLQHPLPDWNGQLNVRKGYILSVGEVSRLRNVEVLCVNNSKTFSLPFRVRNIRGVYQWERLTPRRKLQGLAQLQIQQATVNAKFVSRNESKHMKLTDVTAGNIRGATMNVYGLGLLSATASRYATAALQKNVRGVFEKETTKIMENITKNVNFI